MSTTITEVSTYGFNICIVLITSTICSCTYIPAGVPKGGEMWDSEEEEEEELVGVKDLHQSKWSKNTEEDTEKPESSKGNRGVVSGLMHAYGKRKIRKCVHWGDRVITYLPLILFFGTHSTGRG